MTTTLPFIAHCLEQRDWKYKFDAENSRIITAVQAENLDNFIISIQLSENGKFVQFIAPQLLAVKDSVYKGILFQTMLAISYQVKMLRFEYDPTDGEVRASIELPIEDSQLTERLFDRCLNGLIQLVDLKAMPRLKAVLATGIDPGPQDAGAQILYGIYDELLNLMGEAIARRQQLDS